jgi:inositol oxygenase
MEKQLRNYDNANDNVMLNYKNARQIQNYDYVVNHLHPKYLNLYSGNLQSGNLQSGNLQSGNLQSGNLQSGNFSMSILDGLDILNKFVDLSDPDMELPNIIHAYQTAEQLRKDGLPDWMQLVGLIHDLGKIMFLKGCDEDGTSMQNQFSIVGDTWIVGHPIPNSIVYPEFNSLNKDQINNLTVYEKNCGLNNCVISFGHDEYLYQVLKFNKCSIPEEGMDMIRYHSLYVWHTFGAYSELMNESDHQTLANVKLFNKYDLYTKDDKPIEIDINYYKNLVDKYIGLNKLIW